MLEHPGLMTFAIVFVICAVIMGAVWYFWLAPMERKNHERKLAILQARIKAHEEQKSAKTSTTDGGVHKSSE